MDKQLSKNVLIRQSIFEDILSLAPRMRKPDRLEVWALNHLTPKEALKESFEASEIAISIIYNNEVVAMMGTSRKSLISDTAIVWLLTSNVIPKMAVTFAKNSRMVIDHFLGHYAELENWVDARYISCINWLKWCGAEIEPAEPFGIEKMPFHHFKFRRSCDGRSI